MEKKVEAIVFDWAGTTVDYGSMAPVTVFERIFGAENIHLTKEQINAPMGLDKKLHIRLLLEMDEVSEAWEAEKGQAWTEDDVERLFQNFENELANVVAEYSVPIDGVVETVDQLRKMGLKIGSTTGYTSDMMKDVKVKAAELGYEPDCLITPDIAGGGRPSPYMLFEAMKALDIHATDQVVKVGDTISDIKEGTHAGAWSVGILTGSNLLGLTEEEYKAMDQDDLSKLKDETAEKYFEAGADYVVDKFADLPKVVEAINESLQSTDETVDLSKKKMHFIIR